MAKTSLSWTLFVILLFAVLVGVVYVISPKFTSNYLTYSSAIKSSIQTVISELTDSTIFPANQLKEARLRQQYPLFLTQSYISPLSDSTTQSSCSDCKFFPVGKNFQLNRNYEPTNLVSLNLPGGGLLQADAAESLKNLLESAEANGHLPRINSSYRSYRTQENTFEYWVGTEIAKGKTREEAVISANRYSAKPGSSEHQLGTTVDISCRDCESFNRKFTKNQLLWDFLEKEAHKFGFVISYPANREELTGYVHEPWHIRYVGREIALELYEMGYLDENSEVYVEDYLRKLQLDFAKFYNID